jgi:hypothetical protein
MWRELALLILPTRTFNDLVWEVFEVFSPDFYSFSAVLNDASFKYLSIYMAGSARRKASTYTRTTITQNKCTQISMPWDLNHNPSV